MCLGVPAKIIAIEDANQGVVVAETDGVKRHINVSMLMLNGEPLASLLGRWVLLHVGFAMAVIDEQQANESLALFREIGDDE